MVSLENAKRFDAHANAGVVDIGDSTDELSPKFDPPFGLEHLADVLAQIDQKQLAPPETQIEPPAPNG